MPGESVWSSVPAVIGPPGYACCRTVLQLLSTAYVRSSTARGPLLGAHCCGGPPCPGPGHGPCGGPAIGAGGAATCACRAFGGPGRAATALGSDRLTLNASAHTPSARPIAASAMAALL